MIQIITMRLGGDMGGTTFSPIWGGLNSNVSSHTDYAITDSRWCAGGTIRNLLVANDIDAAVWTLFKNGVATALTATSANGVALNVVDEVSVSTDDVIVYRRVGGTKAESFGLPLCASIEYESADDYTSVYCCSVTSGNEGFGGAFGIYGPSGLASPSNTISVASVAGVISRLAVYGSFGVTDAGKGIRATLWVNGVAQNGSGGTPDTRVTKTATVSGAYVNASSGYSVAIAVGDAVEVQLEPIGSPLTLEVTGGFSVSFQATTANRFILGGSNQTAPWVTTGSYGSFVGRWAAVEYASLGEFNVGSPTSFTLTGLQMWYPAPGWSSGNATVTLTVNGSAPANQPTISIVNGTTYVIDSNVAHVVQIDYGDYFSTKAVPAANIGGVQFHWAYAAEVTSDPPVPPTTVSYPTRRLRQFSLPVSESNKWLFIRKLELLMRTGMGLTSGQGSDPQVMVQLSRDWGYTWGPERWVSAGPIGEYDRRVILRNFGRVRAGGVVRVVVTDPVQWTFLQCLAEIEEGSS